MVGTLVVTLPSKHTGGDLVIEKNGRVVECRGSVSKLALAAFYADCRHEVKPVKTGNRITLTFNLLVGGDTRQSPVDTAVDDVVRHLTDHFATPAAKMFSRAPAAAPDRLVYLLDHEYTERGLSWQRLKGGDAARAALLRAAAEQNDCRVMLALTEIKETWDAYPEHQSGGWGRRWYYDWDEDEDEDDVDTDEYDGGYELNDLIESSTRLVRWLAPRGKAENRRSCAASAYSWSARTVSRSARSSFRRSSRAFISATVVIRSGSGSGNVGPSSCVATSFVVETTAARRSGPGSPAATTARRSARAQASAPSPVSVSLSSVAAVNGIGTPARRPKCDSHRRDHHKRPDQAARDVTTCITRDASVDRLESATSV